MTATLTRLVDELRRINPEWYFILELRRPTNSQHHKPDLLAIHKMSRSHIILDVTIRDEYSEDYMRDAKQDKVTKYEPLRDYFITQGASNFNVLPFWFGACGDNFNSRTVPSKYTQGKDLDKNINNLLKISVNNPNAATPKKRKKTNQIPKVFPSESSDESTTFECEDFETGFVAEKSTDTHHEIKGQNNYAKELLAASDSSTSNDECDKDDKQQKKEKKKDEVENNKDEVEKKKDEVENNKEEVEKNNDEVEDIPKTENEITSSKEVIQISSDMDTLEEIPSTKSNSKFKPCKLLKMKLTDSSGSGSGSDDEINKKLVKKKKVSSVTKSKKKNRVLMSSNNSSDPDSDPDSDSSDMSDFVSSKKYKKPVLSDDSDFENLSADNTKRTKRKLLSSDSGSNSKSSSKFKTKHRRIKKAEQSDSDSVEESSKLKRKHRRIQKVEDSSSASTDEESPSKQRRRNIRKLITTHQLKDETREANKAEKERRKRVLACQLLYNEVTEKIDDHQVTKMLVLESNPDTKEELVSVLHDLIVKLKPHQVEAVKFLWECVVESTKDSNKQGSGCILAHCMGLGKTLSVITFLHTIMKCKQMKFHSCLVVCPLNTVLNWDNEFQKWLETDDLRLNVFELSGEKRNNQRANSLETWMKKGGVAILGYEMFRSLLQNKSSFTRRQKEIFHRTLLDPGNSAYLYVFANLLISNDNDMSSPGKPIFELYNILVNVFACCVRIDCTTQGPDIIVCDEGHVLRNSATGISKTINKIRTQRRIILTGTPLQNNLKEYHCMVSFVKPLLLGTYKEFTNRFLNPITNGQCADSNSKDVKLMKKRIHVLFNLLNGCVQRRDYSHLTKYLTPKYEYVISIRLTDLQLKLYQYYLDTKKTESMDEFINDGSNSSSSSSNDSSPDSGDVTVISDKKKSISNEANKNNEIVLYSYNFLLADGGECSKNILDNEENEVTSDWWTQFMSDDDDLKLTISGKIMLLFSILSECAAIGDKVLLFSQSLLSLDLIENCLAKMNTDNKMKEASENLNAEYDTWIHGRDYFRMDGSTKPQLRTKYTKSFNTKENPRARLFLISTKAGSLGINLVGANRVIIFDASWNPSHDLQAIFRAYRFGQEKPVYIYRFLAQGTMEEKVYDRQIMKQSMSFRVTEDKQVDRHFTAEDLADLYCFNPESKSKHATPMVPKV
ncbi:Transcriptional regulator ATRX [Nymphon striatum]|nr:Transcriptional regulator ATRX [Nymphon striatum]